MGRFANPNENICNYHNLIKSKAEEIIRIKERDYDDIKSLLSDVQSLADDIYSAADYALDAGQRMEDRLKDYRNSIEGLGFLREK